MGIKDQGSGIGGLIRVGDLGLGIKDPPLTKIKTPNMFECVCCCYAWVLVFLRDEGLGMKD